MRFVREHRLADTIVDVHSPLAAKMIRVLEPIEEPRRMLIFQPPGSRRVQVELPRQQLSFHVTDDGLLHCTQLQSDVDPDQDIGVWHGLRSKLVCRSQLNPEERIVLVPVGDLHVAKMGCHVRIDISPAEGYARFKVNSVLGRLESAAEPTLVYTKALLHAYSSFVIPDQLTGRTGSEEAISWLSSAICQPWQPLTRLSISKLLRLAALTPARSFYPPDMRVMKTDHWNEALPETLQNALYRPLVDGILAISDALAAFSPYQFQRPPMPSNGESTLQRRAIIRQQVYRREIEDHHLSPKPSVYEYHSRDRLARKNVRYQNAHSIASLFLERPHALSTTTKLCADLAGTGNIMGFFGELSSLSVNDKLSLSVVRSWGQLVNFISHTPGGYARMLMLCILAFQRDIDMRLVMTLLAFDLFQDLRSVAHPAGDEFEHFQPNERPTPDLISRLVKPFQEPPPVDERSELVAFLGAKDRKKMKARIDQHEKELEEDTEYLVLFLLSQWPCSQPSTTGIGKTLRLDVDAALDSIRPEWYRMFRNLELQKYLTEIQMRLERHTTEAEIPMSDFKDTNDLLDTRGSPVLTLSLPRLLQGLYVPVSQRPTNLLLGIPRASSSTSSTPSSLNAHPRGLLATTTPPVKFTGKPPEKSRSSTITEIQAMIGSLAGSKSAVKKAYAQSLENSLNSFLSIPPADSSSKSFRGSASSSLASKDELSRTHDQLTEALSTPDTAYSAEYIRWLKSGGLWPTMTKMTLLACLSTTSCQEGLSPDARRLLTELGRRVTEMQRENRLRMHRLRGDLGREAEELLNNGHCNWDPAKFPDWLLLEIESDMMIREVQVDVAKATVSPQTGRNSLLQMNMGQGKFCFLHLPLSAARLVGSVTNYTIGKTSCIIPMTAAALADGKSLLRVLAPKALLQQTAQMLQARLGVLLNRPLRHIPFTRKTSTNEEMILSFANLHRDIQKAKGVMLCEPGHILSFTLSGQQRLLDGKLNEADKMTKVQNWLRKVSRDILDESDHTLAVRTQLIYPSGSQMSVDGHPIRWEAAQAILRLVDAHLPDLSTSYPQSIEVVRRTNGSFPLVFFLRSDVEEELVRRLTLDVWRGAGGVMPVDINQLSKADLFALKDFISAPRPRPSSISRISRICPDQPFVRQTIYLLRGLLVNRILMMALKKRWNVQYGLHPTRDPIAVPFSAKGVPSEQSEWGHPDVAILFTCLAFYYDGLNVPQLRQCLEHILKLDDPSTEYLKWVQSSPSFPSSLRAWNSINTDDEQQIGEIWNCVKYSSTSIDYFLNNFVFPRHAKQFKVKLQTNGWDIPLSRAGEASTRTTGLAKPLTTGFSGTNDNRTMLPLNVEQQDLQGLTHTSGEVLHYLLQPRNRQCILSTQIRPQREQTRATETDLLRALKTKRIRILIDAGAQILEMDNLTLAQEWLKIDLSAGGALYFDAGNRPMVVLRSGISMPLVASPFAEDLGHCLVYLDDVSLFPPSDHSWLTSF